ncbi:unnamed protein product [Polarella glacialis]|uniref:RING-type E3 ubiquitin transferase n=1 Tax=Polarella glacialis TaxID=89957 RepID=A0A813KJG3_POLGL|nr:unnamed protein product [Polarella glacialis]
MALPARDPEELGQNWGKGLARCFSVCEGFLDEETSMRLLPIPDSFVCPISADVMRDPVATADGCIYEREYIEQWIREKRQRRQAVISPSTGVVLVSQQLMPVDALKKAIETYVANRPELHNSFGQRRSVQQAAQLLQEELLDKQVRHNIIEDELTRLQKQMKDKDCHITEVEVQSQSLSEELERVRAELTERDDRDRSFRKEVDEMRQKHQCSHQAVSDLRSQLVRSWELELVRAELTEKDEQDRLFRKEVDEVLQKHRCSQQEVSELRSKLASAEANCNQLSSELVFARDAAACLKEELLSSRSVVPAAQSLEEQQQEQEEAASQSGQSDFASCPIEAELLSEPSSQSHSVFLVGQYAEIHGLWSRPDLGNAIGRLLEFDNGSGRWRLLLDTGEYIIIKPESMTHHDVPQGMRPMQFLRPGPSGASVTSRLVTSFMSFMSMTTMSPQLCDATQECEYIGALAHELFGNGAAVQEFLLLGCLEDLIDSLGSESQVVQELAAFALRLVGSGELIVEESGAILRLVNLLFESSCSKVQNEATMTLTSLCYGVPGCRQDILEELDPHKLTLLLVPGGANGQSVQGLAARLCGVLSHGNPPIRDALVKAGVVPQIVALLQCAPSTASHGAFALGSLLIPPACENLRRSIVAASAIPSLVGLLQSEFFQVRDHALCALGFLARDSPTNQLAIATAGTGALPALATLMRIHAPTASVLRDLINDNANVQGMALEAGLLQSAMCCLEDNRVAGYYLNSVTEPSSPDVVHVIQVLMVRAQVSEQSATIEQAINILRSGGLESKTLVCHVLWALLSSQVSSHFGFKDQIIQVGASLSLQRMLWQHCCR